MPAVLPPDTFAAWLTRINDASDAELDALDRRIASAAQPSLALLGWMCADLNLRAMQVRVASLPGRDGREHLELRGPRGRAQLHRTFRTATSRNRAYLRSVAQVLFTALARVCARCNTGHLHLTPRPTDLAEFFDAEGPR